MFLPTFNEWFSFPQQCGGSNQFFFLSWSQFSLFVTFTQSVDNHENISHSLGWPTFCHPIHHLFTFFALSLRALTVCASAAKESEQRAIERRRRNQFILKLEIFRTSNPFFNFARCCCRCILMNETAYLLWLWERTQKGWFYLMLKCLTSLDNSLKSS